GIERGRPLIVVDVDDCLSVYVDHLTRFMDGIGYVLRLESYELEGSMFRAGSDEPLPFDDCIDMIHRFFREECLHQQLMPGGAEALHSLSADAQIVILTNVPEFAGDHRRQNLAGLNVPWPVVVNTGGKGRAMAWLAAAAGAPTAFVDDSVRQIESVASHTPEVVRLHFAGAETVRRLFPDCTAATCQVRDWRQAEAVLRRELGLG
ncbi:MAG TPA: hypothetical protein VFJ13_07705, partial [Paracoccaceae bacterium]|nr:hypothetical protein [Paracoccaceae bacterium]